MRLSLRSIAVVLPLRVLPLLPLLPLLLLFTTGCQKSYACPAGEKDTSQLEKWKAMGVPTDQPGVTVCEASAQNFSGAIPSPQNSKDTLQSLDSKWKADGWRDSLIKGYVPRTDDMGASRKYEKCGEPQNPLGERFMDCTGELSVEVNALPSNLVGKPFLLWVDHRPDVKSHHVLTGTGL
jgi:hypothetical protein